MQTNDAIKYSFFALFLCLTFIELGIKISPILRNYKRHEPINKIENQLNNYFSLMRFSWNRMFSSGVYQINFSRKLRLNSYSSNLQSFGRYNYRILQNFRISEESWKISIKSLWFGEVYTIRSDSKPENLKNRKNSNFWTKFIRIDLTQNSIRSDPIRSDPIRIWIV